jgi:hypothetical protein
VSKISELSDGGSLVSSDYLIAVRSGGNVKVRMDQINVDQVDLGDNEFIRLGNSQDLTMVHTSTQSIINQAGIGDLLLQKAGATKLTINASGIDVTGYARIGTGTTTPALLTLYPSVSAKGWQISANNYVASALEFTCATANGGTTFTTPSMLLNSSGNLAIGSSISKGSRVQAAGAAASASPTLGSATDTSLLLTNSDITYGMNFGVINNGNGWIQQHSNTGTAAAYNLLLQPVGGNVGIGTDSPAIGGGRTYNVALTIDGGVSGGAEDTGALEVGGSTSVNDRLVGSISYFNRDNSGADATTRRQVAIIEAKSVTSDSNAGDDSGANLTFSTKSEGGSVAERLRIDASGNVGIGTSSPSQKLDVKVATDAKLLVQEGNTAGNVKMQAVNNAVSLNTNLEIAALNTQFFNGGTERMRIDASGHAIIPAGVTLGTAAGVYAAANTLDSYEEGNWTPVFNNFSATGTTTNAGLYVKVGNLVYVELNLDLSSPSYTGGGSGTYITGLPFAVAGQLVASLGASNLLNTATFIDNNGGGGSLFFKASTFTISGIGSVSFMNSSGRLRFTASYYSTA